MKLIEKDAMSSSDLLITIPGCPGYWSRFSGIKESSSRPEYSDGLTNRVRYAQNGSIRFDNVTLERAFDPENPEDQAAYQWAQDNKYGKPQSITLRPVRREKEMLFRGSKAWYLTNAKVVSISILENMDTGSGNEVVHLKVELTVEDAVLA